VAMPDKVIVALSMMPLIPLRMAEGAKGEGKRLAARGLVRGVQQQRECSG
jgi:hypothetical protein